MRGDARIAHAHGHRHVHRHPGVRVMMDEEQAAGPVVADDVPVDVGERRSTEQGDREKSGSERFHRH